MKLIRKWGGVFFISVLLIGCGEKNDILNEKSETVYQKTETVSEAFVEENETEQCSIQLKNGDHIKK